MVKELYSPLAGLITAVGITLAAACAPAASASAQPSPLTGTWDGVATVNGEQVPLRYVITPGTAITRQATFSSGLMTFWGNYEIVGNQLHVIWRDWAPRQQQFTTGPLTDHCMVQFDGPNSFDCGGVRFTRVQ